MRSNKQRKSQVSLARGCAIGIVLTILSHAAGAQSVLVRTTAINTLREAVAVYAHSVRMDTGAVLPGVTALPGPTPLSPALYLEGHGIWLLGTATPWQARRAFGAEDYAFVSTLNAVPFGEVLEERRTAPVGWRDGPALTFRAPTSQETIAVLLGAQYDREGAWRGRIIAQSYPFGEAVAERQWPLPGPPVAAVAIPHLARVAVLCQDRTATGAYLHIRDISTGQTVVRAQSVLESTIEGRGSAPVAIALGTHLFVLTSGVATDSPAGEAVSWLHGLDPASGTPQMPPFRVPGGARPEEPSITVRDGNNVWVLTRTPGTDFGYVHRLRVDESAWVVEASEALGGVSHPLRIAFAPSGGTVAIAAGERLELWPGGRRGGQVIHFDDPVLALSWDERGMYVGEGNRLHHVDPASGERFATVSFQSGLVHDIQLVPSKDVHLVGTGGRGIVDSGGGGEVLRLHVPAYITFRGEAVGHELRTILIEAPFADDYVYRIEIPEDAGRWLRALPRQGEAPGVVFLGIDSAAYDPAGPPLSTAVRVHFYHRETGLHAAGSPATVHVRVQPPYSHLRRIAWLVHDEDTAPYADLIHFLAGVPHYFNHEIRTGVGAGVLDDFVMAVVPVNAVTQGVITRQALLDYVERGGSLLLLGDYVPGMDVTGISRWLSPLGIEFDPTVNMQGTFAGGGPGPLSRSWKAFAIEQGASLRAVWPARAEVPRGPAMSESAVATMGYGHGRIAVLASGALLEHLWDSPDGRADFAAQLFGWLARARIEVADYDGDGIPNELEDRNGNGIVDPGETDPFNPDTDGDGVPDGHEDLNRNGRVDEGETSPLNPDSDGDGVWDGADLEPVPPPDAPRIVGVDPSGAPAEGGVDVIVSGTNFALNSEVWFGPHRALGARLLGGDALLAQAPPAASAQGGPVEVRVVNPSVGLSGVLPQGFTYEPLSSVRLHMERLGTLSSSDEGTLAVRLEGGPSVALGAVALRLDTDPPGALEWVSVTPGSLAKFAGRSVVRGDAPEGATWINVSEGIRPHSTGEIAVVRWRRAVSAETPVSITVGWSRITAPNGHPLNVHTPPTPLTLPVRNVMDSLSNSTSSGTEPGASEASRVP